MHETCARTVSSASVYDERMVIAAGTSGSLGTLFCASRAILAMRRRRLEELSGPNDTAWNDTAFLHFEKEHARQLERDTAEKWQFLPKSDGCATQILHNGVVDLTFTIGKKNYDRESLPMGGPPLKMKVNSDAMPTFLCSSFAP